MNVTSLRTWSCRPTNLVVVYPADGECEEVVHELLVLELAPTNLARTSPPIRWSVSKRVVTIRSRQCAVPSTQRRGINEVVTLVVNRLGCHRPAPPNSNFSFVSSSELSVSTPAEVTVTFYLSRWSGGLVIHTAFERYASRGFVFNRRNNISLNCFI